MKKIILLFVSLTISVIAQNTNGFNEWNTNTIQFTDSLYYGTPGDSVWIVDLSNLTDMPVFFIDGNTNATADSVSVRYGVKTYNSNGVPTDTTWGSYAMLRDSSYNVVNLMVNNTVGKDYQPVRSAIQLVKFSLLNYRAALTTRSVRISILALLKKLPY